MTSSKSGLPGDPAALLAELKRGGQLILENARELCGEARHLRKYGAFARAVCLHQLSNEECGKVELVGGWAMSVVLGEQVDVARLGKALTDHRAKNYANAYFSAVTEDERAARDKGDWAGASEIFRKRQTELHSLFNGQKNAALYVGFENGKFVAPVAAITESLAEEMSALNEYFLQIADDNVRLLATLESDVLGEQGAAAKRLVARLEAVRRDQPDDIEGALSAIMREMLVEVRDQRTRNRPG